MKRTQHAQEDEEHQQTANIADNKVSGLSPCLKYRWKFSFRAKEPYRGGTRGLLPRSVRVSCIPGFRLFFLGFLTLVVQSLLPRTGP